MDDRTMQVMRECSSGSIDGSMTFPEVVSELAAVGCEQYHADLRRQEKVYYLPNGESCVEPLPTPSRSIAPTFSTDGIVAALRAVQAGQIRYVEFLARIIAAGCVCYFVYIAGRRAIYLGRNGDMHVEYLPPVAAVSGT